MPRFVTCGPNEAIIVSGCCHSSPTIRAGGRVFVWPLFHRVQRLSLNTMTLKVESPKVFSDGGVPVTIKGVAQVKIQGKDLSSLRSASEMFLDKTEEEIMEIAKATLDGHQRAAIASTKIEKIYKERHEFSKNVQQTAQNDLIDMGLTLVSYIVQDISDDDGYLDALGQEKTIEVTTEARKEIAISKLVADQNNLKLQFERQEKEMEHEQIVQLKKLEFDESQARYRKEEFENKAKSEKAGDLAGAEINRLIAKSHFEVAYLEKRRETEMMAKKKRIRELQLQATVEKKADFECNRQKALAEAYAAKESAEAKAQAAKIKKLAEVKANVIKAQKEAEASVLTQRASAFAQFGDAAKLEMVLAILPRLTAEIAGPITDCKKITSVSQDGSVGFSRITGEVFEVMEQICDSVSNITGRSLGNSQGGNNDDNDDARSVAGPSNRRPSTESLTASTRQTSSLFGTGRRS